MSAAENSDMQPAEIGRALIRIEATVTKLAADMQNALAPISAHEVEIKNLVRRTSDLEDDLNAVREEVKLVTKDANRIAGAGAMLAVIAGILPLPWRK